ncbi:leucine-rich repeat extensin-like protein 3 [Rosa rugosa]|uniref:leucine-rich repeat extensin-like protein 3 n=1 Tax=Rosa rugosa TaxID=74645 RepID=UPI002B40D459|nr:leucine-rich repeat extensin-like protein 3 [Rosa rugosa]
MATANSISISMVPFSSTITTFLLIMLVMHSATVTVAMESSTDSTNSTAIVLESKDQTTSCTMCDECPNPCPVPSSPPPPPPVVECPPPPSLPPPSPPVVECPPPPSPPVVECPPPPSPAPLPVLPECPPPPPPPASPCQETCSYSPPGVPALIPNRPPRQPYVPNPGNINSIFPPNVNPVYYYNPPKPYFSKSVDLKMQYSTTVTSIFVFFSTSFLIICFF